MKRVNQSDKCFPGLRVIALLAFAGLCAAQSTTEITLPGTRVFPESITSTADGTLIIGSLGHGDILRVAPKKTAAEEWIKPGTGGLNGVLGVFADEKGKQLWVCSNNLENKGEATAVMSFDLKTGAPKGTYPPPGEGPLCNDIAVAGRQCIHIRYSIGQRSDGQTGSEIPRGGGERSATGGRGRISFRR